VMESMAGLSDEVGYMNQGRDGICWVALKGHTEEKSFMVF
jgi:hypothetical protein